MSRNVYSRHEVSLNSASLALCHKVLKIVCFDIGAEISSEEAARIAAITIELYQQGVRDEDQLRVLVSGARGF